MKRLLLSLCQISPEPPQTNLMHVFLLGERTDLLSAAAQVADTHDIEFFRDVGPTNVPGVQRWELTVGAAAAEISDGDLRAAVDTFRSALGGVDH